MIDVDEFQTLKERVAELTAQHEQTKGRYQAALDTLKELGYSDVKAAQAALHKKQEEEKTLQAEYQEKKREFEEKWDDYLTD